MKSFKFMLTIVSIVAVFSCSDDSNSSSSNENGTIIFNNITYDVIGGGHMLEGQTRLISFSSFSDNDRQFGGNIYYNTTTDFAELAFNEISDQGVALVVTSICDSDNPNPQGLANPNISLLADNRVSIDDTFSVCVIDGTGDTSGPFDLIINIPSL